MVASAVVPIAAGDEEWPLVAEMQERLKKDGVYGTPGTTACFEAWGGEGRCLLRVLRGNKHKVEDAMTQLYGILEFRAKYDVDNLNPEDALTHPCRPFWVAEIPGQATREQLKGCVIQVTVGRYIQPEAIVERFSQDQMDMFFILWMVSTPPASTDLSEYNPL